MKLTDRRIKILTTLRDDVPLNTDGWSTAQWIAEANDQFYNTPWASSQMKTLCDAGLVLKQDRVWYRISDAGRKALAEGEASVSVAESHSAE